MRVYRGVYYIRVVQLNITLILFLWCDSEVVTYIIKLIKQVVLQVRHHVVLGMIPDLSDSA